MRVFYPNQQPAGTQANGKPWPVLRMDQLEAIYRIEREITDKSRSGSALVGAGMGSGKAQPLDSLVLTPTGFIRMGDVSLGTEVVTPSGDVAVVSGNFPQGKRPVYRLTLVDGREVLADEDHLWTVLDRNRRRGGVRVMSTRELVDGGVISANGNARFEIEKIEPVDLGKWGSTLDPWLIGALLGNGGLAHSVMFSTGDADTRDRMEALLPAGVRLMFRGNYDYQVSAGKTGGHGRNPVKNELRRLGIMGHGAWTKFVPTELMNSSVADRLSLIQGLLDTDGSPVRSGFEFSSASPQLAADFVWLVRSLGGRATHSVKALGGKEYQRVYGRLPERFAPFRCARKLSGMTVATKYALNGFTVRAIEYVGEQEAKCIMVDHPDHEYVTDGFTRTHNTVVSVEVILHTAPARCLIVGVRDAYSQWEAALEDQQSDLPVRHRRILKRIDGTEDGQINLSKLLDGDRGLFYVGLEYMRTQDWEKVSETFEWDADIKAMFGDAIGETMEPVTSMKQKHTYKNMEPLDLLISDEAHKHSNQKTAALKTVNEIPAKAKIALSGTFFGNKFENAWSVATWLWTKSVVGTKGMFEAKFCVKVPVMSKDGKRQLLSPRKFPLTKITGERNPGEYVQTLPCYVFIETPVGPVPEPEVVWVDLTAEQLRQYEEMETQSLTWIPSTVASVREPLVADIPLTQRGRLRTAALGGMTLVPGATDEDSDSITFAPGCKSNKLDTAYDVLHRPSWLGKKALILTHSKPFAKEVARRIGQKYSVALKTGDTTSKTWDDEKRRFMLPMSDPNSIQYLVAVISAVGTAMDGLQAECSKVLWLSEDDNNTNNMQGANRIWRQGVNITDYESVKLVSRHTIDEGVLAKNDAHAASTLDSVAGA